MDKLINDYKKAHEKWCQHLAFNMNKRLNEINYWPDKKRMNEIDQLKNQFMNDPYKLALEKQLYELISLKPYSDPVIIKK